MALIRRVSRLFTADMHAVLDQIEEPEIVLKQAIREMEEELARQVQRGKWLRKEIETTSNRIDALAKTSRELDAKLDICFESGNEELARKLTRRKLEALSFAERQEAKCSALRDQLVEHDTIIANNRDQLEGMRQKAALLCSEAANSPDLTGEGDSFTAIDEDEVEIAFLREKQARVSS